MGLHAHPQQHQWYREDQHHENPFHLCHKDQTDMMEEIAGIHRAAHESHGLLLDARSEERRVGKECRL